MNHNYALFLLNGANADESFVGVTHGSEANWAGMIEARTESFSKPGLE